MTLPLNNEDNKDKNIFSCTVMHYLDDWAIIIEQELLRFCQQGIFSEKNSAHYRQLPPFSTSFSFTKSTNNKIKARWIITSTHPSHRNTKRALADVDLNLPPQKYSKNRQTPFHGF